MTTSPKSIPAFAPGAPPSRPSSVDIDHQMTTVRRLASVMGLACDGIRANLASGFSDEMADGLVELSVILNQETDALSQMVNGYFFPGQEI